MQVILFCKNEISPQRCRNLSQTLRRRTVVSLCLSDFSFNWEGSQGVTLAQDRSWRVRASGRPSWRQIRKGKLLLIYICNFHVLSNLLLIYICKLHWNLTSSLFIVRWQLSRALFVFSSTPTIQPWKKDLLLQISLGLQTVLSFINWRYDLTGA